MPIGTIDPFQPTDIGAALTQTALMASGPSFELQFYRTQDAILARLNQEIDKIHGSVNTKSLTALLDVRISRLQDDLSQINDYKTRTDAKAGRISQTLDAVSELITLADPSTVTEFDAKLAQTISLIQTTIAPTYERFGVPDRVRAAKSDALAQLQSLVHNNFATQTDIDNVTAILTSIQSEYTVSRDIVASNSDIAFTQQQSLTNTINELARQATNIKTEAISEATAKVKEKQKLYGQILTAISLSFEGSRKLAEFVAENVALPQDVPPGSVVNLFS